MTKKGGTQTEAHKIARGVYDQKGKTLEQRLGKGAAKATKQKMSDSHWSKNGGVVWSKGLTKEMDIRLENAAKKQSKSRKGKPHKDECQCPFCNAVKGGCEGSCNPNYKGGKETRICVVCGSGFECLPKSEQKSCCVDCGHIQQGAAISGENHPSFGKKFPEWGDRQRKVNNPNWNNGSSFEPYDIKFNTALKYEIRERDDFTCQYCGISEDNRKRVHCVHHIDYNKKNNARENLITLCTPCNNRANSSREKWEFLFTTLQEIWL